MIIFDWNKKNTFRMKKYIQTRIIAGVEEIHYYNPKRNLSENIIFRNFPNLHIEKNQMVSCCFEDCGKIYFSYSDYGHGLCNFRNIKSLFSRSSLTHCSFAECECSNNALVELNNCYLGACQFENVRLLGETYLINGNGHAWGYGIKLNNITSERQDKQLYGNIDVR